jgi:hypothetical protein
MHAILLAVFLLLASISAAAPQLIPPYPHRPQKKIIEFGWDMPDVAFVQRQIRAMEERPFDGIVFIPGKRIPQLFDIRDWRRSGAVDLQTLAAIRWQRFTHNFLCVWSSDRFGMMYFDDDHWRTIAANLRLLARAARESRCKGILLDVEYYSSRSPWSYEDHREGGRSRQQVEAKVRQRGSQVMRALQEEYPDITILCTFLLTHIPSRWEMLPAFVNGMLDAMGPEVRLVEGDEESYFWQTTNRWFERYDWIKNGLKERFVDPVNWEKYSRQVQVGKALYIDEVFAVKEGKKAPPPPAIRRRWEHNVYFGLATTDEFLWCYSERMSWWGNTRGPMGFEIPPRPLSGAEAGIRSARGRYEAGEALGWEMIGRAGEGGGIDSSVSVRIADPVGGARLSLPATVRVEAASADRDVVRVDFYLDMVKVGSDGSYPFSMTFADLLPRSYSLIARAFAGNGRHGTSGPVRFAVDE